MITAPEVVSWPETSESLCQVLAIQSGTKCHGQTKNTHKPSCGTAISKQNRQNVEKLLDKIVSEGNLEKAHVLLEEVAYLVMCKRNHQNQGPTLLARWEKALAAAESRHAERISRIQSSKEKDSSLDGADENEASVRPLTLPSSGAAVVAEADLERTRRPKPSALKSPVVEKTQGPQSSTLPRTQSVVPRGRTVVIKRTQQPASSSTTHPEPIPTQESPQQHTFERFGRPKSVIERNVFIMCKLRNQLLPSERPKPDRAAGWIYTYTLPSTHHTSTPLIKIGRALEVNKRMQGWKRKCNYTPVVLHQVSLPLHVKVEKLAHAYFWNQRMRDCGCPGCGVQHEEWFDVDVSDASRVVEMWAAWSRREPYDEENNLKAEWVLKLDEVDLRDPRCWELFVRADVS